MRLLFEAKFLKPVEGSITSEFGEQRKTHKHGGIDIACASNTPIKSPLDGKVITSKDGAGNCGGMIEILHNLQDGSVIKTKYCHLNDRSVQVNDEVKQGDVIGKSGGETTASKDKKGRSTGPHLHFEVAEKKGDKYIPVDPKNYIGNEIETIASNNKTTSGSTETEKIDMVSILKNFLNFGMKENHKKEKRLLEERIVKKLKNKKTLK